MRIFLKLEPFEASNKVQIFPCVLYSMRLFFGELIITIFVDILKVGSVDEAVWGKKVTGQYLKNVSELMALLSSFLPKRMSAKAL